MEFSVKRNDVNTFFRISWAVSIDVHMWSSESPTEYAALR